MNPGLLATNLQRNFGTAQMLYVVGPSPLFTISANLQKLMARPAKFGAYTELFAGLDPSITAQDRWGESWVARVPGRPLMQVTSHPFWQEGRAAQGSCRGRVGGEILGVE